MKTEIPINVSQFFLNINLNKVFISENCIITRNFNKKEPSIGKIIRIKKYNNTCILFAVFDFIEEFDSERIGISYVFIKNKYIINELTII